MQLSRWILYSIEKLLSDLSVNVSHLSNHSIEIFCGVFKVYKIYPNKRLIKN